MLCDLVAHRGSGTSSSSQAPSSYTRKRARLSTAATTSAAGLAATMTALGENEVTGSRSSSRSEAQRNQNAATTGTWNSTRSRTAGIMRSQSRTSHRSQNTPISRPLSVAPSKRGSISQASIPISALISPHAPSISHRPASIFHMRDPRKPPKIQPTPWTPALPRTGYGEHGYLRERVASILESGIVSRRRTQDPEHQEDNSAPVGWYEGGGSPPHAWLFFLGFIIFPVWWIAAFLKIPKTRSIEGGHDGQKSVILDDPQVEHGKLVQVGNLAPSLNLFSLIRCKIVAQTMSTHECSVLSDLYPLHHPCCHLCSTVTTIACSIRLYPLYLFLYLVPLNLLYHVYTDCVFTS